MLGIALIACCLLAHPTGAQVATGIRLYTDPDPDAKGGMRGSVTSSSAAISAVFALPPAYPERVYKGSALDDGHGFEILGLPAAMYDLLIVCGNRCYEGLTLQRGQGSLTDADRDGIRDIIERSEPFYNEKTVHRLDGVTGHMTGSARAFCTFLRSKKSIGFIDGIWRHEHRRSLKLVLLEHVGPGWQVERTREIFTVMVKPGSGTGSTVFRRSLGRIRVTDSVRELGDLDVAKKD
jgi:hypothetical protein